MAFKIPDTPEELFRQGKNNFSSLNKWFPLIFFIFIGLFVITTSFYSVEQDEVGVIRQFGKYNRTTEPGLHFKLPFGIERLDKVKVTRIFKEEFGFRSLTSAKRTEYSTNNFEEESLMLTGDLNVLDVSWIVQFRISDPVKLLFKMSDPQNTLRVLSEAVMRQVIGDHSVSEALTSRKNEINQLVKEKLQTALDSYESGIQITKIELQEVLPPNAVKASFNEVNQAEQEREKVINESWEAYNKVIPKAKGQAEKTVKESEGYAISKINKAKGDAAKFLETWDAYKSAQDITRKRLYLETLEEIIPKAGRVYVSEPKVTNVVPLLNLNEASRIND